MLAENVVIKNTTGIKWADIRNGTKPKLEHLCIHL